MENNNNKKDMSVDEIFRSVTPENVKETLTPDSVDEDVKEEAKASNEATATTPLPEGITEKDVAAIKKLKSIVNFAKSMGEEKSKEKSKDNEDIYDKIRKMSPDEYNDRFIDKTRKRKFEDSTRPSFRPSYTDYTTPPTAPMYPQYTPTYGLGYLPKRFMNAGYDMFFTPEYMKHNNFATDGFGFGTTYGFRTPGTPDPITQWTDRMRNRDDKINEIVTVAEWKALQGTNFMSSEEDIKKFIAVITKLLNAGIFSDEDKKSE